MLFNEYLEDIKVYRQVAPVSGWGDSTWELVTTIQGRFEPIDANESFVQNQPFPDVTEIFLSDYTNIQHVRPEYILEDTEGVLRRITGEPERWKWGLINSHLAAKCRRAQWEQ